MLFTVTDDGPGFDPETAQRGHGYINMADRLGAIGGTVRWDRKSGVDLRCGGRSHWSRPEEATQLERNCCSFGLPTVASARPLPSVPC